MKLTPHLRIKIINLIQNLQNHVNKRWYAPLLGFLAFLDYFIIIIPMDGILISSTMLRPKNWILQALFATIGSTSGAIFFFYLVNLYGFNWILEFYPQINQGAIWNWTLDFFNHYGILLVFLIAATPFVQQPVVALAALSHAPPYQVFFALLFGRLIKYVFITYISSHSPKLLSRLWGVQNELDEVGIHLNKENKTTQRSQPE